MHDARGVQDDNVVPMPVIAGEKSGVLTAQDALRRACSGKSVVTMELSVPLAVVGYANDAYKVAATRQAEWLRAWAPTGTDMYHFGPHDLCQQFVARNAYMLAQHAGAGYWVWKPYVTMAAYLASTAPYVMYLDTGSAAKIAWADIAAYFAEDTRRWLFTSELADMEVKSTKRYVFRMYDCDDRVVHHTFQRIAGFFVLRRCKKAERFLREWMRGMEDPLALLHEQTPSITEHKDFVSHRHDQSVFSVLAKKYRVPAAMYWHDCLVHHCFDVDDRYQSFKTEPVPSSSRVAFAMLRPPVNTAFAAKNEEARQWLGNGAVLWTSSERGGYFRLLAALPTAIEFVWVVSPEVRCTGDWTVVLSQAYRSCVPVNTPRTPQDTPDLIATALEMWRDHKSDDWYWWQRDEFGKAPPLSDRWKAYMPVYGMSRRLLERIVLADWHAHEEMFVPTVCAASSMYLAAFSQSTLGCVYRYEHPIPQATWDATAHTYNRNKLYCPIVP